MKQLVLKLNQYKFNGAATFVLIILAANLVIAFVSVGFFIALVQVFFSFLIAFLGNKSRVWKEGQSENRSR